MNFIFFCYLIKDDKMIGDKKNSRAVYIKLGGMKRKTKWLFPQTKQCPHIGCHLIFNRRSETVKHFKAVHSSTAVWCNICHASVKDSGYCWHFKKCHPNDPLPKGWSNALLVSN